MFMPQKWPLDSCKGANVCALCDCATWHDGIAVRSVVLMHVVQYESNLGTVSSMMKMLVRR